MLETVSILMMTGVLILAAAPVRAAPEDILNRATSISGSPQSAKPPISGFAFPKALPTPEPDASPETKADFVRAERLDPQIVPDAAEDIDPDVFNRMDWSPCALAFIGGPHPANDPGILRILDKDGIVATFFAVGHRSVDYRIVLSAIADAGHEIGIQGFAGTPIVDLGHAGASADIADGLEAVESALAPSTRQAGANPDRDISLLLPDQASIDNIGIAAATAHGLRVLRWKSPVPGASIRIAPGTVVLLSSGDPNTLSALPGVVTAMIRSGCTFVTASEWVALATGRRR